MKCCNCRHMINEDQRYCTKCGQRQAPDPKTVADAASGSEAAMSELYSMSSRAVTGVLRMLLSDNDAVMDIAQDTYFQAFTHLNTLKDPAKFIPWVKTIAHNRAIDHLRKKKPLQTTYLSPDGAEQEAEFEDDRPENLPDVLIDREETGRLLSEILGGLPDDQRTCIIMYYVDGMSTGRIADSLGIPAATVKSRLNYGRRKMTRTANDMERRGISLRGLSPIAFFLLLLNSDQAQAQTPPPELWNQLANRLQSVPAGQSAGNSDSLPQNSTSAGQSAANSDSLPQNSTSAGQTIPSTENAASSAGNAASVGKSVSSAEKAASAAGKLASSAAHTASTGGSIISAKWIAIAAGITIAAGGGTAAYMHSRNTSPETVIMATETAEEVTSEPFGENQTVAESSAAPETIVETQSAAETETPVTVAETETTATVESTTETAEETSTTAESTNEASTEAESTVPPETESVSITDAYQQVIEGCREDAAPENLYYAVCDINSDGIDELILGDTNIWEGDLPVPYNIYGFDGSAAVPFFGEEGTLANGEFISIRRDGSILVTSGNGGVSDTDIYNIPSGASTPNLLGHYESQFDASGSFLGFSGPEGDLSYEEFDDLYRSIDELFVREENFEMMQPRYPDLPLYTWEMFRPVLEDLT